MKTILDIIEERDNEKAKKDRGDPSYNQAVHLACETAVRVATLPPRLVDITHPKD